MSWWPWRKKGNDDPVTTTTPDPRDQLAADVRVALNKHDLLVLELHRKIDREKMEG